jgi:hypothetical protein
MDASALLTSFLTALSTRSPLLLVAAVGAVLSWVRVRPVSKSSHRICVVGLLLLAAHVLADTYGRVNNLRLFTLGVAREEIFRVNALWTLVAYALLVGATACLVAAIVVGRKGSVAIGVPEA